MIRILCDIWTHKLFAKLLLRFLVSLTHSFVKKFESDPFNNYRKTLIFLNKMDATCSPIQSHWGWTWFTQTAVTRDRLHGFGWNLKAMFGPRSFTGEGIKFNETSLKKRITLHLCSIDEVINLNISKQLWVQTLDRIRTERSPWTLNSMFIQGLVGSMELGTDWLLGELPRMNRVWTAQITACGNIFYSSQLCKPRWIVIRVKCIIFLRERRRGRFFQTLEASWFCLEFLKLSQNNTRYIHQIKKDPFCEDLTAQLPFYPTWGVC